MVEIIGKVINCITDMAGDITGETSVDEMQVRCDNCFNGNHQFGDLVRDTNGRNNGKLTPLIFQVLSQFSETAVYGYITDNLSYLILRINQAYIMAPATSKTLPRINNPVLFKYGYSRTSTIP